jgi:hypothetical protein
MKIVAPERGGTVPGTESWGFGTLNGVGVCVAEPPQLSFGPRAVPTAI